MMGQNMLCVAVVLAGLCYADLSANDQAVWDAFKGLDLSSGFDDDDAAKTNDWTKKD